jgi:hypothetical protein
MLMASLKDPDVAGQAVKALRTGQVAGAATEVRSLLETAEKAWVRRECKKYLAKFG